MCNKSDFWYSDIDEEFWLYSTEHILQITYYSIYRSSKLAFWLTYCIGVALLKNKCKKYEQQVPFSVIPLHWRGTLSARPKIRQYAVRRLTTKKYPVHIGSGGFTLIWICRMENAHSWDRSFKNITLKKDLENMCEQMS